VVGSVSADELTAVASGLRDLGQQFRTRSRYVADDIAAADEFHRRASAAWHGRRATTSLGVARDYFDATSGMADSLSSIADNLDAFATDADDIAGWLRPYEAVLARDEETVPGERQDAWHRRDQLMLDWVDAGRVHAGAIATESEPLEVAYAAELGEVDPPVVPMNWAMPILASWAVGVVELDELGFTNEQIATAFAGDAFTLTGSIHAESTTGQSWAEATSFVGEGTNANYEGGGWITSSTGEEFPIAFPTVVTDDGTYTADSGPVPVSVRSVANLGGDDGGWRVVEIQSGVERFYPDLNFAESGVVFMAGTTGLVGPLPSDSGLDYLVAPPSGGPPFFTSSPPSLSQVDGIPWAPSSDDPLSYPEPDQVGPYMPAPPPGLRPLGPVSAPVALNVADLAPTIAGGIIAVTGMNNDTHQAYHVVFEENEDGRRRDRLRDELTVPGSRRGGRRRS